MSLASRRDAIDRLGLVSPADAHAGLWLDRMLPRQLEKGDRLHDERHPHTALIDQAANISEPAGYAGFFDRWRTALAQIEGIQFHEAVTRGRMVVGLGAEGVLETAISLHHTYGVPYIPGSALKGLAAAYAHGYLADDTWRKPSLVEKDKLISSRRSAYQVMFGDTTSAGYVTFFDALYKPGSGHKGRALWPDVMTVHHPDYYQERRDGEGNLPPPADWDSPTPISFVTATGSYLLALAGPSMWVNVAFDILALALDAVGIGGKTSSGYGRLTLDSLEEVQQRLFAADSAKQERAPHVAPADQPARPAVPAGFRQQVSKSTAGSLPNMIGQWRMLDPVVQIEAAQIMIARAKEIKVRDLESRPWYRELLAAIEQVRSDQLSQ